MTTGTATVPPSRMSEARVLSRIAAPLSAAFLAEFAMFLIVKMVVGHVGYLELAAVGLASDLTFEVIVVLMGALTVIGVLMAHAEGGARKSEVGHALRQGLIVATMTGIPTSLLILQLDRVMVWTAQDPAVIALAAPFLVPMAWTVLPVLWFSVFRVFAATLHRSASVMIITVAGVGLNWLLAVGLVEGRFGLPEVGYLGGGWAFCIVSWAMFVVMVATVWFVPTMRGYGVFRGRLRFDPSVCREIFRLGVPVGGLVLIETGLFAGVSLLSGVIGPVSLATYSVIMGWVGIPFVIANGIAEASMIRVAYGLGAGSALAARQSGMISLTMGVAIILAMVVVPVSFPERVVDFFLDPADPGFAAVAGMARSLFYIVALFQVFDGLQVIASHSLRGMRDTLAPLFLAAFGYWGLGLGGGAALAFPLGFGVEGLWWGLAAGLFATAMLLTWRFHRLTRARGRP